MIDVLCEKLLTPQQVAKLPPFLRCGSPVAVSTVWRWIKAGVLVKRSGGLRVKLEHVRLPSGIRSSQEAVDRFIGALNAANRFDAPSTSVITSAPALSKFGTSRRSRASDELDTLGLK